MLPRYALRSLTTSAPPIHQTILRHQQVPRALRSKATSRCSDRTGTNGSPTASALPLMRIAGPLGRARAQLVPAALAVCGCFNKIAERDAVRQRPPLPLLDSVQSEGVRDVRQNTLFVMSQGGLESLIRCSPTGRLGRTRTPRIQFSFNALPVSLGQCDLPLLFHRNAQLE